VRACQVGGSRRQYLDSDNSVSFPVRPCLCNALVANVGYPQVRAGKYVETGLVTSGDDLSEIPSFSHQACRIKMPPM